MNTPQVYPTTVSATQKVILASVFLTILALVAGLIIASILFPSSAGSTQAARPANQPEAPLEKKRIKLASSSELFTIPNKVAQKSPAPNAAETIVPRQKNKSLNPYVKVDRRVTDRSSVSDASTLPAKPVTHEQQELAALTDSLVTVLERLKQQEQNTASGSLDKTPDDLHQAISRLVKRATTKGKSEEYVRLMIDDALAGRNAVPQALAKLDGKLDTRLLLAAVLPKKPAANVGGLNSSYMAALQNESKHLTNSKPVKISKSKKLRKAKLRKVKLRKSKSRKIQPGKTKPRYIIVRRGDNLTKISERAYGDPYGHEKIYQANKTLLTNSYTIDIGQRLLIP